MTSTIDESTATSREPTSGSDPDDHPAGVFRAVIVIGIVAVAAVLPYLVPGAERFRVFRPGTEDRIPFCTVLDFRSPQKVALGGVVGNTQQTSEPTTEQIFHEAPLPEPRVVNPQPLPPAQQSNSNARLRIPASEYSQLTREIENAELLQPFFVRLKQVALRRPNTLARISMYGTSTMGSDRPTSVMRHSFQERFGDGGKGWVPISPGWQYQRHGDVEWSYRAWATRVVNRGRSDDGHYGFGGVLALNRGSHSTATFGTMDEGPSNRQISIFRLFHQARPGAGEVSLQLDDGEPQIVSLAAESIEDRVHELQMPRGSHQVALGVPNGDVRLYGVVMENEGPGVVVDGLMLVGAFTRVLLNFDPSHIRTQVAQREPDLLIYWLGANDAISTSVPWRREEFTRNYATVIRRMRAGRPQAACLVMSIMDKGESVDGYIRTFPRVPDVVAAQQQVANDSGCAFFNTFEAIGGEGTMRRWYHNNPRLVSGDFGHLTGQGSQVVGSLFYQALVKAYDDFLAQGG